MINNLKKKLNNGEAVIGTFISINSPEVAQILASVGYDFLMIDYEHGGMGIETVGSQIMAMKASDCTPLLRIPSNSIENVKKGLDSGAYGLMVPMVNNKEEAEKAISYFNYPPRGVRGFGPSRANVFYNKAKEYYKFTEDGQLLTILQIESKSGVENIDEILQIEGIDVIFIGPNDLAFSLGVNGDTTHPLVLEAIDKVLASCKKYGVIPGIMTNDALMQGHLDKGFKFLIKGTDATLLYNNALRDLEFFNQTKSKL